MWDTQAHTLSGSTEAARQRLDDSLEPRNGANFCHESLSQGRLKDGTDARLVQQGHTLPSKREASSRRLACISMLSGSFRHRSRSGHGPRRILASGQGPGRMPASDSGHSPGNLNRWEAPGRNPRQVESVLGHFEGRVLTSERETRKAGIFPGDAVRIIVLPRATNNY